MALAKHMWRLWPVLGLLAGCDDVSVQPAQTPQSPVAQVGAARVLVPAGGIARLYQVAHPEGLRLTASAEVLADDGQIRVQVGPLEQDLELAERIAQPTTDQVVLDNRARGLAVFIPVRITDGTDIRICRYRVKAEELRVQAMADVVEDQKGYRFVVSTPPVVTMDQVEFFPVGDCAVPALDFGASFPTFDDALEDYLTRAASDSALIAFETNPSEVLGLMLRRVRLDRLSPFANRRGNMQLDGQLSAFEVNEDGLEIGLDFGTDIVRAGCAPPIDLGTPQSAVTRQIDADLVAEFNADFAMAVSLSTLDRLGRAMALSGFACRGLDDVRKPADNQSLIPASDLLLGQVGLGKVPVGAWVEVASSPGDVPLLATRPESSQLVLIWSDLTLDVYGEVLGARVKIAELITSATANLRPAQGAAGIVRFELESIELNAAELNSKWFDTPPSQEDVDQWARRTLLLVLANQFAFPMPIEPGTPVQVTGLQVRAQDVVVYLKFD